MISNQSRRGFPRSRGLRQVTLGVMMVAIALAMTVSTTYASLQVLRRPMVYAKDAKTLTSIAGASVSLDGVSAGTTDSSGGLTILTEGLRQLTVAKGGYQTIQTTIDIEPGTTFTVYLTATSLPTTLVFRTDFEDVTKRDANRLNMGIGNWFEFEGDGGAGMWVEGLDRRTPNISCHSGGRCIGMELTDITKSRRNEFNIMHLKELVGDEILVSVWLYLPADWQLHLTDGNWYQMVNPYFTDGDPWAPYAGISVIQDTGSPVFHLNVNWRDDDQQQYYLDDYPNFSLPRGRWFQVQYYVLRSPTNGILKIWFDGNLVANHTGLKTEGTVDEWFTTIAKIYYDTSDTFSPYRIWVDDLEIYKI